MRHFTKTHNDLKWLFPIAKTKREANEVFSYVEENAKHLADSAGIEDKEQRDLAIDAFMKGYSYALQLETSNLIERVVNNIYQGIFKVKYIYSENPSPKEKEENDKYFRFFRFKDLLKSFSWGSNKSKEKARKYFTKMVEGTGFDHEAPLEEQLKVW
jgi:hypothetical protein